MEADLRKTNHGCGVKEEKRDDEESHHREDNKTDCNEEVPLKDEKQLQLTKAEMGEVRKENQRLRLYLDQIMKDYQTLQNKFQDILHQQEASNKNSMADGTVIKQRHQEAANDESDLVSLSLGRTLSSEITKKDERCTTPPTKSTPHEKGRLGLGLDCKLEISSTTQAESSVNPSTENSLEEAKDEAGETWPPQKNPAPKRSGEEQEVSQQNPAKKTRVSVRVRCDTPTMNDGCQWRKYGQKIAKGNPCPRAYYRCTVSPSCPVRKQVQRCAQDMSILITTYEGTHNHPLPMSATAMASTTSAAASMLTSGSSTSGSNPNHLSSNPPTTAQGLSFYLTENSKLKPIYLPHSSFSPSPSCPTITLDLTSNTLSSASPFNYRSSIMPTDFPPRYNSSSTNLNFSSLESSAALPISWGNGALNYGKNQMGTLNFGTTLPQENLYQSYMQNKSMATPNVQNPPRPDSIEAATRAITSDPKFQSALQAALTSIIGGGGGANNSHGGGTIGIHGGGDKLGQNMKLGDAFPVFSSFPSTSNANKCATSYLNKSIGATTLSSQSSGQNSLPFSSSKSKSTSPETSSRDQVI